MLDKILQEELDEAEEMSLLWERFSRRLGDCRKVAPDAAQEKDIMSLRDEILRRYTAMLERLEIPPQEGGEICQFMERLETCPALRQLSEIGWRRLEGETRHIAEGLGKLRDALKNRAEAMKAAAGTGATARNRLRFRGFGLICLAAAILLFFLVLGRLLR